MRAPEGAEVSLGREPKTMADTYNGYCVKCREKRDFEGEEIELKNGTKAAQGKCPVCGT
ncbi:MAG: hypothetical protein H0W21_08890, partial [Actinobacteria bacterium]|nr:hypothetical protein [Actinomycetota bacterium]